ncbi:MAG: PIG-L family deacetylase [Chitinophagaceae bacterium]|nr:MAG: PIG-L family deacetylase [Chitinophagaceae bacterium]
MLRIVCFVLFLVVYGYNMAAQQPQNKNAGEIQLMLKNLNNLGSALHIAAHPDDENTRLITWLSKKRNIRTGYLSITRGDGGQNMIGTEIGTNLGIIRTQELIVAREIDGGHQFFTRAVDFGYSKTHEETMQFWDEDKVLEDMVYIIRKFRPDVLITRFPPKKYEFPTHGHHTASSVLAEQAFEMAGDSEAFPEQLESLELWSPKRLYWNTSHWFYRRTGQRLDTTGKLIVDFGAYLPELGYSCSEIAAVSRSQHRSQGFGTAQSRGMQPEYLEFVMGDSAYNELFEGIDLTWGRVPGAERVGELLHEASNSFDPQNPEAILPLLVNAHKELQKHKGNFYADIKLTELEEVIYAVAGLHLEVVAENFYSVRGGKINVDLHLLNRSDADVRVAEIQFSAKNSSFEKPDLLKNNQLETVKTELEIASDALVNQAYWLREQQDDIGMFKHPDMEYTAKAENDPAVTATVTLNIEGALINYTIPLEYKWTDRVKGELYRPFFIAPDVSMNLANDVYIFPTIDARRVNIQLRTWKENLKGTLKLDLPQGWTSEPESIQVDIQEAGRERNFNFNVRPPSEGEIGKLRPLFVSGGTQWSMSFEDIRYDHIPYQSMFAEAEGRLLRLESAHQTKRVGYIMGAGDLVNRNLEEAGYEVVMLDENNFDATDLSQFPAILVGIRAYNTEEWLVQKYEELMDYIRKGGNLIVQYQTTRGLLTDKIGPYPFEIDHGRVTDHQAKMNILETGKNLTSKPNNLTEADFEGWVQERGLYFAENWDDRYYTVFEMNDPGEEPHQGSLIIAPYGEGHFMYTGISFFRVMPAGVPGIFRLLSNMIDYGR